MIVWVLSLRSRQGLDESPTKLAQSRDNKKIGKQAKK